MRGVGTAVVAALLVLAAAQAAAAALGVLLLLAVVYGACVHPRETFGLLGLCLLAGLIERYPLPCLGLAAIMAAAKMLRPGS